MAPDEPTRSPRSGPATLWLVVVLFPIVLNALLLSNVFKADPALRLSGLDVGYKGGIVSGRPLIDPSIGYVFQALGKRSADEILHGVVPWWDSDQGVGLPLAAEMSSASFFPLTLLQALPNGRIVVDVAVQILAGLCMLLLLRRLALAPIACALGAVAFECNGTFAWLSSGWCYPLPFVPLLLYGIELCTSSALGERVRGPLVTGVAIALSITAAMIETAYLDAVLCVAWAAVRVIQSSRVVAVEVFLRLTFGGFIGLLLASPLLLAFVEYLSVSFVGMHTGVNASNHLSSQAIPQTILPYVWGPIYAATDPAVSTIWGNVGGYGGAAVLVCAILGCLGSERRGLRLVLAVWVALTYASTFGFEFAQQIVNAIPGLKLIASYRYFDGSREFALMLLAAFFIDDTLRSRGPGRAAYAAAVAVPIVCLSVGLAQSSGVIAVMLQRADLAPWFWGSLASGCVVLVAIVATGTLVSSVRTKSYMIAAIVICEAIVEYSIPTFANPRHGVVSQAPIRFLREHVGLSRVFALGPLFPSYGSYFDVPELDYTGLPLSRSWSTFVSERLDSATDPNSFDGTRPKRGPGIPSPEAFLRRNVAAYEATGVKYVVSYRDSLALSSPVFEEPTVGDPIAPLRLLDAKSGARLSFADVPEGTIEDVGFVEGNYENTADGTVELIVCSGRVCVHGHRALSESTNNRFFIIHLDRPVRSDGRTVTVAMRQVGAKTSDVVWLYAPDSTSRETLEFDGKATSAAIPYVRFLFARGATVRTARRASTLEAPIATRAYHDAQIDIDELPTPSPYYSARGCTVRAVDRERVATTCAGRSSLVRRELFFDGWAATVNGAPAEISSEGEVFESIRVPAGESIVRFSYTPPNMEYGYSAALLGCMIIAYQFGAYVVRSRRGFPDHEPELVAVA